MRHRGRDRGWSLYSEGRNVRPLPLYKQGKQGQFAHLTGCYSNFTNFAAFPFPAFGAMAEVVREIDGVGGAGGDVGRSATLFQLWEEGGERRRFVKME